MDLVKNLLKIYYLYTLPSDVRYSTDVRSFLIARTSGHFRTSDTSTTETFLRMSGTLRTSIHIRSILTDVRPRSDVRILYTGLWVTLFTAAGRPMTVGRPDLFVPPDVRRSPDVRPILYPKRSLLPTTYIYIPFPSTG